MSEGIDFVDELARAVFLIGIPYPPLYDRRVDIKKNYMDKVCNDTNVLIKKINGN